MRMQINNVWLVSGHYKHKTIITEAAWSLDNRFLKHGPGKDAWDRLIPGLQANMVQAAHRVVPSTGKFHEGLIRTAPLYHPHNQLASEYSSCEPSVVAFAKTSGAKHKPWQSTTINH